jgi:hypothetical protein
VIKAPTEESFYFMQQLCIAVEPVLDFSETALSPLGDRSGSSIVMLWCTGNMTHTTATRSQPEGSEAAEVRRDLEAHGEADTEAVTRRNLTTSTNQSITIFIE